MTAIAGLRGSGQFTTDFRPTNYRELFTLLEPNGTAPLNALLAMAASEATDDPKFNHFRDELPNRVLSVKTAYTVGTAVEVDVTDDLTFVVPNVILHNLATGENLLVTSRAAGVLTVVRNIGGTAIAAGSVGDKLIIAGYADKEGAGKPTPVTFDPTTDYNFTQIFKTGVAITGTMQETYLRTGSKEQEMVTKALKMHMSDIERAMFFGRRSEDVSDASQPRRTTGGLLSMITNVIDAASGFATGNTITEDEMDRTLVENIFAYGGKEKLAFCGPRALSNFQKIAKARWQPTSVSGSYGVSMSRYSTFAGDLLMTLHPMFRQVSGVSDGMDAMMVILDMPHLKYRFLKNRDTNLRRNVQSNDTDGVEHFYQTECGLEMTQSKPHAIIKNWQAV